MAVFRKLNSLMHKLGFEFIAAILQTNNGNLRLLFVFNTSRFLPGSHPFK